MNEASPKRLFAVIGPPRCGTSALTRGLKVLGIDLGDTLRAARAGVNDEGFWEDLDIAALNTKIYRELGCEWHGFPAIEPADLEKLIDSDLHSEAMRLIESKLEGRQLFGFKDLQITRLLPFWTSVFSALHVRCDYLISCRNPDSMARSLGKLTGFDRSKCHFLWNEFTLAAILHTQSQRLVAVQYNTLIERPDSALQRIASELDLQFDQSSAEFLAYKNEFLDTRNLARPARAHDAHIPEDTRNLYSLLSRLADDSHAATDTDFLAGLGPIRARHEDLHGVLRSAHIEQSRVLDIIRGDLAASRALLEISRDDGFGADSRGTSLAAMLLERDQLLERASQGLVERTLEIMTVRATLDERTATLEDVEFHLREHVRALAQCSKDLVNRTDELVATRALLAERTDTLQQVSDALAARVAAAE